MSPALGEVDVDLLKGCSSTADLSALSLLLLPLALLPFLLQRFWWLEKLCLVYIVFWVFQDYPDSEGHAGANVRCSGR